MTFLFRAVLLATVCAAPAFAQQAAPVGGAGIAAVVNDQIITTQDVQDRARLLAISTGMNPTPDALARLSPQVTKQLIDQTLQMQEIVTHNVTVSDDDVAAALGHIEQGNGLPPGGLKAKLAATGIPFGTMLAQLRVEIGWQQMLHQVLGPGLQPTPGDMNAEKTALKAQIGSTQYHLSEIFVPVTDPAADASARNFTNDVIAHLRQGAPFAIIAAQFSQADSALSGGDVGFKTLSQLDPAVADIVRVMPVGAISNPIRVPGGYEIVALVDKHDIGDQPQTMLSIRQAFAKYPEPITNGQVGPDQAAVINKLVAEARQAKSCDDISALNAQFGNVQQADPGPVNLATVTPPAFQAILAKLAVGQVSEPLVQADGASVVMLCSRQMEAASLPSDEAVANIIVERRVDMESQQLLDILRQRAIITQNN